MIHYINMMKENEKRSKMCWYLPCLLACVILPSTTATEIQRGQIIKINLILTYVERNNKHK